MRHSVNIKYSSPWRKSYLGVYEVDGAFYITTYSLMRLFGIQDPRDENGHVILPKTNECLTRDIESVFAGPNAKYLPSKSKTIRTMFEVARFPLFLRSKFKMTEAEAAEAYAHFEGCLHESIHRENGVEEDSPHLVTISSEEDAPRPSSTKKREREEIAERVNRLDATVRDMTFQAYRESAEFHALVRAEVVRQAAAIRDEMRAELMQRPGLLAADLAEFRERRQREIEAEIRADPELIARCADEMRRAMSGNAEILQQFRDELRDRIMSDPDLTAAYEAEFREKTRIRLTSRSLGDDPSFWKEVEEFGKTKE